MNKPRVWKIFDYKACIITVEPICDDYFKFLKILVKTFCLMFWKTFWKTFFFNKLKKMNCTALHQNCRFSFFGQNDYRLHMPSLLLLYSVEAKFIKWKREEVYNNYINWQDTKESISFSNCETRNICLEMI